jgi:hypothetical protein
MANLLAGDLSRSVPAVRRGAAVRWAAALSLLAGYLHLTVIVPHFQEWWAYGVFFLASAAGQILFAALILWRTWPWLPLVAIAGNVAMIGMYVVSRTNGVPLGPHAGRPEEPGLPDLVATVAELGIIVALVARLPRAIAGRVVPLLMLGGVALWAGRLTGVVL